MRARVAGLARRYARALYDAVPAEERRECLEALRRIAELWRGNGELRRVISSPLVPAERRAGLLETLVGGELPDELRRLLVLLLQRHRHGLLGDLAEAFRQVMDDSAGKQRVQITTAVPLDDNQRQRLLELCRRLAGADVDVDEVVDARVLGGVEIRIGDQVIDATLRGQLERLVGRIVSARAGAGGGQ